MTAIHGMNYYTDFSSLSPPIMAPLILADTYIMRIVLVNPGPCFHPVTIITASPVFIKPRFLQ
jgi:hypothetical protein